MSKQLILFIILSSLVGGVVGFYLADQRQLSLQEPTTRALLEDRLQSGNPGALRAQEMTGTVIAVQSGKLKMNVLGFNQFSLARGRTDTRSVQLVDNTSVVKYEAVGAGELQEKQQLFTEEYRIYQQSLSGLSPTTSQKLPPPPNPPQAYAEIPISLADIVPGSTVRVEGAPGILLEASPAATKIILLSGPLPTSL